MGIALKDSVLLCTPLTYHVLTALTSPQDLPSFVTYSWSSSQSQYSSLSLLYFTSTSHQVPCWVMSCSAKHSFTIQLYMFLFNSVLSHLPLPLATLGHVSMALADIWNLHFFRFVLPTFCLSDRMTAIHVRMLSFLTALYSVLLMATAYIAFISFGNP